MQSKPTPARERRAAFRIVPPSANTVLVQARYGGEDIYHKVTLGNLSQTGIMIRHYGYFKAPALHDKVWLHLAFAGGPDMILRCTARHIARAPGQAGGLQLGLQFDALKPDQAQFIGHTIAEWQRMMNNVLESSRG
jgi:hypothetical protein